MGAGLQGYCRLNQAQAALDVMREFWQQGGDPDDSMFEVLVNCCVRTGQFKKALQVGPHWTAMDKSCQSIIRPCCTAMDKFCHPNIHVSTQY